MKERYARKTNCGFGSTISFNPKSEIRNPESPAGFTLIEVIAALAIVSIALLGLLELHLTSIKMTDTARTTALAILVAQEKAAETAAGGWPAVGANQE